MTIEPAIQPLNVTAATMLIQLLLVCLLWVTSRLTVGSRSTPGQTFLRGSIYTALLEKSPLFLMTVVSFVVLLLSEEFYAMWSPILGGAGMPTFTAATSTAFVFYVDVIAIGYLILITGGSGQSPFVTALFTIPALAIFLRSAPNVFFWLATLAAIGYVLLLAVPEPSERQLEQHHKGATAFVNVAFLFLSMVTGYITRPVSIDQLQVMPPRPTATDTTLSK